MFEFLGGLLSFFLYIILSAVVLLWVFLLLLLVVVHVFVCVCFFCFLLFVFFFVCFVKREIKGMELGRQGVVEDLENMIRMYYVKN